MGTRITVVETGQIFEPLDIQQVEDVFTSNLSSASGGIPMITLTLPQGLDFLALAGKSVIVESTTLGNTSGILSEMTVDNMGSITCLLNTKLNPLVRLAKAKPYSGKLKDLITYYFRLGGILSGYQFEPGFPNPHVYIQGWEDVIWNRLIGLQQIYQFEISLVSDFITMRPWRTREAEVGHIYSTGFNYSTLPISKFIEIDYYSNRLIQNEVVLPVRVGERTEVSVSVGAREVVEVEMPLSASVSSIKKPKFMESVPAYYTGTDSVYTVMDKDGFKVTASDWKRLKGSLTAKVGPDSKSVIITMVGPDLSSRAPYKLAFAPVEKVVDDSGKSSNKPNLDRAYDTLNIVGTGIGFNKKTVKIRTGARASDIVEEIGTVTSMPEISTISQLYNSAIPLLSEASGGRLVLSGTMNRINQRGQTGELTSIPYDAVEDLHVGMTYGSMEDSVHTGKTYGEVESYYNQQLIFEFDNQVFGNSAGARIYDVATARWYRITSATISMHGIDFEAEDDLTYDDIDLWMGDRTYGYVEDTLWPNKTYWDVEMLGMK